MATTCPIGFDAARRIGPSGRAFGVDVTPAMLAQAQRAAAGAGLEDGRIVRDFDCFRRTSLERKFSGRLKVCAVAFHARKPRASCPE